MVVQVSVPGTAGVRKEKPMDGGGHFQVFVALVDRPVRGIVHGVAFATVVHDCNGRHVAEALHGLDQFGHQVRAVSCGKQEHS